MNHTFQQLIIVGNLLRDSDLQYTVAGQPVLNFIVCVENKWEDRTGLPHEETIWHHCTLWGELAEVFSPFLTADAHVLVIGRARAHLHINAQGSPRASLNITVTFVKPLSGELALEDVMALTSP